MDASMARYGAIVAPDDIRIQDGGRLQGLPYLEVFEAMRRGLPPSAHKAHHGVLVDEPDDLFT
jgi:hypothetical protein